MIPAARAPAPPTVVLPMAARDAFLAAAGRGRPAGVPLPARPRRPTAGPSAAASVAELATDLRRGRTRPAGRSSRGPTDDRPACSARAAASRSSSGRPASTASWSRRGPNRYAARIPRGTADRRRRGRGRRGAHPAADGRADRRRVHASRSTSSTPGSTATTRPGTPAREERLAELTGTALTRESSGRARFVSRDELRYSLRSLHLFAPWVRRIHLVTAGQVPDWLDTDHPQVARRRPPRHPAGRRAADVQLARDRDRRCTGCPDLAEHFVYLNDDVFLGRPLRPETFFSPAGLFAAFLSADDDRPRRRARRAAVPQGGLEQPAAAPRGLRRRHDHTTSRTRRTRTGARCSRRSSGASPTRSRRPRARRSAPTPTCRC